jgi:hypothetical protein
MKIALYKEIKTITESIDVEQGVYYFSKDNGNQLFRVDFEEDNTDGFITYDVIELNNYSDEKSIKLYSDGCDILPKFISDLFIKDGVKIEPNKFISQKDYLISKFSAKN